MRCIHCNEAVLDGDEAHVTMLLREAGKPVPVVYHRECELRGIVGSVACQQGKCQRLGGPGCGDDPALTIRQAALAASAYFHAHGPYVCRDEQTAGD